MEKIIKIIIHGANGKMGKKVLEIARENNLTQPIFGIDVEENLSDINFPIYNSFSNAKEKADVVIDFSSPKCLDNILSYCQSTNTPAVLCSTGYTEQDIAKIEQASKKVAIFRSANMSLGVNVLIDLCKRATTKLDGFDIEIIEKHHNKKVDAPSGTALMLADSIKEIQSDKFYVYGREGIVGKREKNEIGIHAIRGGNIVGEHQVIYAGENETITLIHQATDRSVFAVGAVKAAIYLSDKKQGLFNMNNLISEKWLKKIY